jgi:DNA replication protein DnaC
VPACGLRRDLDTFGFDFNKMMNRALVYELATARFIAHREDVLFLGPPGTGKSHLAQAIGRAAILQGYRVVYRDAHTLLEELTEATLAGTRKDYLAELATVPLLIIDDLGMRKLAHTAAEDLLELIMRRYERASTLLTSSALWGSGVCSGRARGNTKCSGSTNPSCAARA